MSAENKTQDNFENYADWPHVLVVDDDRRIRDLLVRYLSENGFIVLDAQSAEEAREILKNFEVDVLVVDIMMGGQSGLAFTTDFRKEQQTPVILLTALGETQDRIAGLEAGADDYLPKPFEPKELVLRLNAVLKRTRKVQKMLRSFAIGPWAFNADLDQLEGQDGNIIKLTDAESLLLKALTGKGGEAVSREELARLCNIESGERAIDVQVTRLRRKIEEDTKNPRYLQTARGKGYLLRFEEI